MNELLQNPLFQIGVAAVILYILFQVLKSFFRTKKSTPLMPRMSCNNCGWEGQVGKYDQKCRKCGSTNLSPVKL